MLFIGGARDGKRFFVPYNSDDPVLKIPMPYGENINGSFIYKVEIYIKKEIWRNNQHIFSVMAKDGSVELLNIFLDKYNKRNQ